MSLPTKAEIHSIFGLLAIRPTGYLEFFQHVDENVIWELTGQNTLSGTWESKAKFLKEIWLPIIGLIGDPGPELQLVNHNHLMSSKDGWVAIELKTSGTRTKLGNCLYSQHYCWHCKFNSDKKIVEVRAFIDSSTAERVLAEERLLQDALAICPDRVPSETAASVPQYPMIPFDPAYKQFLKVFYHLADAEFEHEKYTQCFTSEALLVLGSRSLKGREAIYGVRKGMWETVKRRTHHLREVFPFGPNSNVAMIHGLVDYEFRDGSRKSVDWTAKCNFVKGDRIYLDRYQVWLADNIAWAK